MGEDKMRMSLSTVTPKSLSSSSSSTTTTTTTTTTTPATWHTNNQDSNDNGNQHPGDIATATTASTTATVPAPDGNGWYNNESSALLGKFKNTNNDFNDQTQTLKCSYCPFRGGEGEGCEEKQQRTSFLAMHRNYVILVFLLLSLLTVLFLWSWKSTVVVHMHREDDHPFSIPTSSSSLSSSYATKRPSTPPSLRSTIANTASTTRLQTQIFLHTPAMHLSSIVILQCNNSTSKIYDGNNSTSSSSSSSSSSLVKRTINVTLPGKKGIGFIEAFDKVLALNTDWYYNWGLEQSSHSFIETYIDDDDDDDDNINDDNVQRHLPLFVPMAWDGATSVYELYKRINTSHVRELMNNGSIASLVLGFNEPDHEDQANMSVEDAIERWQVLQSLNVPLVSPSAAHPDGEWMIDFMNKITTNNTYTPQRCCNMDVIGVHYYGTTDFLSFTITVERFYRMYGGVPLILTEFAPADWNATKKSENKYTTDDVLKFTKQAIPWLEQQEYIVGYSWYSFDTSSPVGWTSALFDENNNLTELGLYYQSV